MNFDDNISTLLPFILKIKEYICKDIYNDDKIYEFQKTITHKNLPILGIVDIINEEKIVDLKFSMSDSMEKYIDQIIMYYLIYDPSLIKNKSLELWNLFRGEKIIVNFDKKNVNTQKLLCLLSDTIDEKLTNMTFFYDLETTGLIMYEQYPDIIEIYIEEYTTKSVWCDSLVRLKYGQHLDNHITNITCITENDLYLYGRDIQEIQCDVNAIFAKCKEPIFIAHNGNSFDHKIMRYYDMFDESTKTLDSRSILNLLITKDNIDSCKLGDIFKFYCDEDIVSHRAKADVYMLIKIFEKLFINVDIL
jgi:hypothetical protein